jgi:hypothetical protein
MLQLFPATTIPERDADGLRDLGAGDASPAAMIRFARRPRGHEEAGMTIEQAAPTRRDAA